MKPQDVFQTSDNEAVARSQRRFFTVWGIVGVAVITAIVVYLLGILAMPVSIVFWTCVFVFCLGGMVDWFEGHGLARMASTVLSFAVGIVIIAVFSLLMFSPAFGLSDQFNELLQSMPAYIQYFADWASQTYDQYAHIVQNEAVKQWINNTLNSVMAALSASFESGATSIVAIGTGIANGFMAIGFALVIAFWMLLEMPALNREVKRLIGPKRQEDYELLSLTVTRVVGGYINATLLQCFVIGVACGVLFFFLNIPSPAALAGITGVLNIIPVVGPWLGGAVAALVGLFISPMISLAAILGTIVIQQFVYTFVSPKIMQNAVDIHPAVTLFALMVGSAIGGAMSGMVGSILGMLLAIPAVGVGKSLFVYYFEKKTGRQLVAYDGVIFQGTPSEEGSIDPLADALSPADYAMEHAIVAQERVERIESQRAERELQRTGRLEAIKTDRTDRIPLELPFIKLNRDRKDGEDGSDSSRPPQD